MAIPQLSSWNSGTPEQDLDLSLDNVASLLDVQN